MSMPINTIESVLARTMPIPECGCWIWMGPITRGYGRVSYNGTDFLVHRLIYENLRGPITRGLVMDHKCRVPSCCNPDHLRPLTDRENILIGFGSPAINARKTHCKRGHELAGENLITYKNSNRRNCRKCDNARKRVGYYPALKEQKNAR